MDPNNNNNNQQFNQPQYQQPQYQQPQYQQPQYQQPQYQQPYNNQAPQSNNNGLSVAALICGIVGLVGGWIPVVRYFTLVSAIVAIILGVMGRKKAAQLGQSTKLATAGMVLGIISVGITVLAIIYVVACFASLGGALSSYPYYY
jgi:hypothetical protein